MNKSKPSTSQNRGLIAVIGGSVLLFAMWLILASGVYTKAVNRVVLQGDALRSSDPRSALVYYQAADAVSGATPGLISKQALVLSELGQFEAAGQQINRLQQITLELRQVQAKMMLERGVDVEQNLSIVFGDSEGATTLMAIRGNQTALAAELQARGLVRSAQRIILAIPDANRSAQDYLILAKSQIAQSDYQAAKIALESSLKLDITNLEVHKLYKSTLEKLGKDTTKEQEIINQLESGKI